MSSSTARLPHSPARVDERLTAVVAETTASDAAVVMRDLGKCYEIYARPADRLKQTLWRGRRQFYREFWALRGVSFDVKRGEALGIIGRNGSGKSTLLQIIAGTLRPTEGRVDVRGRVHALLELGSGFNPEFTGRENVYLNGAVLGLTPRQIDERFDAIAGFADIGDFLEQPIKTYSSGMVVRLAFAVQALLEPDLLIVDEALAVGDEGFQRKCFGWLERFRSGGGTVLFVTHATQLVVQLCDRAALLERGQLLALGGSKTVVDIYQNLLFGSPGESDRLRKELERAAGDAEGVSRERAAGDEPSAAVQASGEAPLSARYDDQLIHPPEAVYGTGEAEITDMGLHDEQGRRVNIVYCGQRCTWRYRVCFEAAARGIRFGMMLKTTQGIDVAGVSTLHVHDPPRLEQATAGEVVEVRFELTLNVTPGVYFFNCGVSAVRDDEEVYLQRRVDTAAIRVLAPDKRDLYGLCYVDPRMSMRSLAAGESLNA